MTVAGFQISGAAVALGVITGMVYGILAVGLVLVYRTSRIINFAHGEIGAFGAALLGVAAVRWHLPYWPAFALAIAAGAALGGLSEVVVVRRLRGAPVVISVVATIGLAEFISLMSAVINNQAGAGTTFPQPSGVPAFDIGALRVTPAYTATLILTPVLVVALAVFLQRGRLGLALRATSANPESASLSGVPTGRMSALSWAIAGGVAAYTAALVLPTRGFTNEQFLGPGLLLRALACAVIARLVSLPAAMIGGVVLGVIEQVLLTNYPSGGVVDATIFIIILLALLLQQPRTGRTEQRGSWAAVEPWGRLPDSFTRVAAIRNLGSRVYWLALAIALVLPAFSSNTTCLTFVIIAAFTLVGLSVGIVTGLSGQLSLGQFALAGVGATLSYVVTRHGGNFVLGLVTAGIGSAAVALAIGLPALRIRGLMLAVTTLGFALAAQDWLLAQPWMLGAGVTPRRPVLFGLQLDTGRRYYYVALAVVVAGLWLSRNVWRSGVGRRMRAVRDNDDAARSFTVRPTTCTLQAFAVAGFLAGLGGAVYGHSLSLLASSAFPLDSSINAAAVSVVGGMGLMIGPLLGTLYIVGVPAFLPLDNAGLAATSFGWLALILTVPGGIGQLLRGPRAQLVGFLARRAGVDPQSPDGAALPSELPTISRIGVSRPSPDPAGAPILRAAGLSRSFGGVRAVNGVSLAVGAGETLGLIGPNGAGKTTLFELLSGFTKPDDGHIHFRDREITHDSPETRAKLGVIRSFQEGALFPTLTVADAVMVALEREEPTRFGRSLIGLTGADRRKAVRAHDLVGMLGLGGYRDHQLRELSTGTRRIAELTCLIALDPVVLLLDEPTSGIAQRESEALGQVLVRVKDQLGLTLVLIEHDIPLVMGIADRVVAMESGRILAAGTPAEIQRDPAVVASYLGTDEQALGRSDTGTRSGGTCDALTRRGVQCSKRAGDDGRCAQHRHIARGLS